MKIALIGYGKMGKAIEEIALERGHEICVTFSSLNPLSVDKLKESAPDVAIEFTQPNLAVSHIYTCTEASIPIVVGTTAWFDELKQVKEKVQQKSGSLIYASNFSIGVNIFFKLNEILAKLMNNHREYAPSIEEIHHLQKLDAPSGTAVTLAEGMLQELEIFHEWKLTSDKELSSSKLPVTATRLPEVPGTHLVKYESPIDRIELKHEAKNRKGFALGAIIAAEFIQSKKGIFTMSDVLNL
jgi:4-hydroxy-tetrahydrodipicolinate reductase